MVPRFPRLHHLGAYRGTEPFALLQTCRQIYTETASLPYAKNAFGFKSLNLMLSSIYNFDKWQYSLIEEVHCRIDALRWFYGFDREDVYIFLYVLPNLKSFHVDLYSFRVKYEWIAEMERCLSEEAEEYECEFILREESQGYMKV